MGQIFGIIILGIIVVALVREAVDRFAVYLSVFTAVWAVVSLYQGIRKKEERLKGALKTVFLTYLSVDLFTLGAGGMDDDQKTESPNKAGEIHTAHQTPTLSDSHIADSSRKAPGTAQTLREIPSVAQGTREAVAKKGDMPADQRSRDLSRDALWREKGWTSCVQSYKKKFLSTDGPAFYRYYDGKCGELSGAFEELKDGDCYMNIRGPGGVVGFRDFEISLHCIDVHSELFWGVTCSNAKNFYSEEIERRMRSDPRCTGFPDLLAKRLKEPPPQEFTNAIKQHEKTGRYKDLPSSIRYSNRNTDERCRRQGDEVRRLENHSNFESSQSIRKEWQQKFESAVALGCNL